MILTEQVDMGEGDLYQMLTYLVLIIVSAVVMTIWLKRRGRRKRK